MKKFLSFFVAALFCTTLGAQTLNEDFEGEGFPPEGWTTIDGYAGYGWKKAVKGGSNCAYIMEVAGTENWLITPQLRPAAGEKLTFSARVGDYASSGELRIEVSLSGTDAGSFEMLTSYSTSSKADNHLWKTEWKEYSIDLSAYKGAPIYIAFHQAGGTDGIYVDNVKGVSLQGNASCDVPMDIVLSDLSANSVTFTWSGDAAEYQYVLVEDGEELDWNDAVKVAAKTVTLNNLYEETDYVFYVRSYCSETEQSLAPKVAFKTPCASFNVPWIETFTRDQTGSEFSVAAPDCWTLAEGSTQVSIVKDKTYDEEGNASTVTGQAHLQAIGGGPKSAQVFAMPTFNAPLNTLEVAFEYKTSLTTDGCGMLEVGYMTNPNKASTFISLKTLERTLAYKKVVVTLEDLPSAAKFIAFRFAGGTSDLASLSMDNFIVAEIGKSGEVDPSQEIIPDAGIWALSYCEAQFHWYSYSAEAFAIGLFDEAGTLIARIPVTTGECDRFAYADGICFPADDDYDNHYYCSTRWIVNAETMQKGSSWEASVINVGTQLGLKPGTYHVEVNALNTSTYAIGEELANIPFTLVEKKVANLKAEVAEDKKTATLTWEAPEFGQGERLYVRVWSGETVAYDNFDTKDRPESPFVVDVVEGLSYTAIVQVVNKNQEALGSEAQVNFTVGVNSFEPQNPHAEVFGGDNVTFSWEADVVADRYVITLYLNGEFYTTLTVDGTSKTTTMPKDGTWTWTVQAFNKGSNGNYFEASNAVEGNAFESKAADIPEDAVVLDVWTIEAAYMDDPAVYDAGGRNAWYISLATGEEGGNGLPSPVFMIYSDKHYAISGVYNVSRGNIDLVNCGMDMTGKQEDAVDAVEAEIRLQFDGYDEEKAEYGHRYGYYSGEFRIVGKDGKTYVGKFMEQFCNSFNFSTYSAVYRDHVGMWDEDPDYNPFQGIENIITPAKEGKFLQDGQLFIRRDGKTYNAQGLLIK